MKFDVLLTAAAKFAACTVMVGSLIGCSSTPDKPKPAELAPNAGLLGVRLAWTSKVGVVDFPLDVKVDDGAVAVASSDGVVASFDARTGADLWRTNIGSQIAAGVGSDGKFAAVVTRGNELVTLDGGREIWRQKLSAQGFTAPLVAGGRVFILAADRSITAFDGLSGRKLWVQQRPSESLVLRQAGVLLAVGDTLVAGLSGRLVGISPANGAILWEAPIASPRGTNDIERLVDLVGRVSRDGDVVCARAFQAAVGCVNASRGTLVWTKPALGHVGIHGDDKQVYGVESDGKVMAWRRIDGERVWVSERLRYRSLTAPLVVGRSVAVGDDAGLVHLLSREDGSALTRVATDGSAVVAAPVLAAGTLVVVTRSGGVFGFVPE
ncbi:MAG: outer membrane protein assembly factor BamB [Rhodoferax sp.]|uniref:outer membrane protein assembly factor BamB n=1 Tax=Rhodoferax sp. TaxID=50421 RepID=UPI00140007ED|nr:outer membrane protein assembly factor BamB [Rhodoferax sp.]NDP37783.1 outer membrane protein assembly factor BamB [Rhodoferax sp.]